MGALTRRRYRPAGQRKIKKPQCAAQAADVCPRDPENPYHRLFTQPRSFDELTGAGGEQQAPEKA